MKHEKWVPLIVAVFIGLAFVVSTALVLWTIWDSI